MDAVADPAAPPVAAPSHVRLARPGGVRLSACLLGVALTLAGPHLGVTDYALGEAWAGIVALVVGDTIRPMGASKAAA